MNSAMIFAVVVVVLVSMALALVRATIGPGRYNRVLAINLFGTKTILLVATAGFVFGPPASLDIAILYALVNFVAMIAVLRLTHLDELVDGDPPGDGTDGSQVGGGGP